MNDLIRGQRSVPSRVVGGRNGPAHYVTSSVHVFPLRHGGRRCNTEQWALGCIEINNEPQAPATCDTPAVNGLPPFPFRLGS